MDKIPFLINCLKEFNYPNIHSMDHLQTADIFSKNNRKFLISWFLKQLDEDYEAVIDKVTEEKLAEIIYCHGFCMRSEKTKFINGELDNTKEMVILCRMFKHLQKVFKSKTEQIEDKRLSLQQVEDLIHKDTNIFPMYGAKQILTPVQRDQKLKKFREEIERIKNMGTQNTHQTQINFTAKKELNIEMANIEANLSDFETKAIKFIQNQSPSSKEIKFNEDFATVLKECSEKLEELSTFVEDINVIATNEDSKLNQQFVDDKKFMSQISGLCTEISYYNKQ